VAGNDLRQHGLEDEVVFLVDQGNLHVLPAAQEFLQVEGGVQTREPATENQDAFLVARGLRRWYGTGTHAFVHAPRTAAQEHQYYRGEGHRQRD
jgi:hypothetical protein